MIFGVGINDVPGSSADQAYVVWHSMLRRAYSPVYQKTKPTYAGVSVCEEWHRLSTFMSWYAVHGRPGWQLDKDLLSLGNKVYAPDTCCFLPGEINMAITTGKPPRDGLPTGVYYKSSNGKYCAQFSVVEDGVRKTGYIGLYESVDAAYDAYHRAKKDYIRKLADKWKPDLLPAAYDALAVWQMSA